MSESNIEWTEHTWNPVRGCSMAKGSEAGGCLNCYAARMAARNLPGNRFSDGSPLAIIRDTGPRWTGRVELQPHMLDIPLRRKKPTVYFVNSMSDLFHEDLPDEAIDKVFAVMALCPQHTFQVLTKRAERMQKWFQRLQTMANDWAPHTKRGEFTPADVLDFRHMQATFGRGPAFPYHLWPLPNVWLGVSCEDRKNLHRLDLMRQTPAAIHFVSLEPLLEDLGVLDLTGIDWVIVGGESGPGARPCKLAWINSIIGQCQAATLPCFVKQVGSNSDLVDWTERRQEDRKGGNPEEWPDWMRVREMPRKAA